MSLFLLSSTFETVEDSSCVAAIFKRRLREKTGGVRRRGERGRGGVGRGRQWSDDLVFAAGREALWHLPVTFLKVKDIPKNVRWDLAKDLPSLFQSRSSKVEMPRLGEETSCSRGELLCGGL